MRIIRLCLRQYISSEIAAQHLHCYSVMRLLLCYDTIKVFFILLQKADNPKSKEKGEVYYVNSDFIVFGRTCFAY